MFLSRQDRRLQADLARLLRGAATRACPGRNRLMQECNIDGNPGGGPAAFRNTYSYCVLRSRAK
jgi:hypothetical protein